MGSNSSELSRTPANTYDLLKPCLGVSSRALHNLCKVDVRGSIPLVSTRQNTSSDHTKAPHSGAFIVPRCTPVAQHETASGGSGHRTPTRTGTKGITPASSASDPHRTLQPRHHGLEPALVVAETGYMIGRQLGSVAEARFYQLIAAGDVLVEVLTPSDYTRIAELIRALCRLPGWRHRRQPVRHKHRTAGVGGSAEPPVVVRSCREGARHRAGRQDRVCTWNLRKTRHSDAGWWQLLIIAIVLGLLGLADETHRLPSRS